MDDHFKKECAMYTKSLKCKACKVKRRMLTLQNRKQVAALRRNEPYTDTPTEKFGQYAAACGRCSTSKKKCTLKEYKKFSGAVSGKCDKF